jgi:hypothetical protein
MKRGDASRRAGKDRGSEAVQAVRTTRHESRQAPRGEARTFRKTGRRRG